MSSPPEKSARKVLIVGPFSPPVNGCSYANEVLRNRATALGWRVDCVNSETGVNDTKHGQFSIKKVFAFLQVYSGVLKVPRASVLYLTPGQTFFGFLKYAPFMVIARCARVPYVLHIHGNYFGEQYRNLSGLKRFLFGVFAKRARAGIVLSESLRKNFSGLLPDDHVFPVENFAGDDLIDGAPSTKRLDLLRVVYLSNLVREKGILELLDALIALAEREVLFEAKIAGKIDRDIEEEVKLRLSRLGPSVEYLGIVQGDAKRQLLNNSNVLVLPTYYAMEGQPIALLEAMATGNVVVSTRHAGIPDIIDESNGFLIEGRSVEQLTQVLFGMASRLDEVPIFAARNIAYAKDRFTESNFANRTLAVLESASS